MGLDGVELVMNLEDAFGIAIPDAVAQRLVTPRLVVNWLEEQLVKGTEPVCLDQRAFYLLRRAAITTLKQPRSAFRPGTKWTDLLPRRRRRAWALLRHAVGASKWPLMLPWIGLPAHVSTVGATARYLATYTPAALARESAWSREQIEQVVSRLVCAELGITSFGWDQRFVDDLGMN